MGCNGLGVPKNHQNSKTELMDQNHPMSVWNYQFQRNQQYAEIDQKDKNYYRTFFIVKDYIQKKDRIIAQSNWVYGEVPNHIKIISPMYLSRIRSGVSH